MKWLQKFSILVYFSAPYNGSSGPGTPVLIDDVARDLIMNSGNSIVGEVMNLDDFLDELIDPADLKAAQEGDKNQRYMFSPLEMMFSHQQNYHYHQPPQFSSFTNQQNYNKSGEFSNKQKLEQNLHKTNCL